MPFEDENSITGEGLRQRLKSGGLQPFPSADYINASRGVPQNTAVGPDNVTTAAIEIVFECEGDPLAPNPLDPTLAQS